tara:strand:+ start:963 stop:2135 length:1173 start_codon:yes stop_codon:yes gene_type:complete
MNMRLLNLLVCPIDKTPLELFEWESSEVELSENEIKRIERNHLNIDLFSKSINSGLLVNHKKKIFYPIINGIPRMLVFKTGIHEIFLNNFNDRIKDQFPSYTIPDYEPMKGESDVLKSFSKEWTEYNWNDKSYWSLSTDILYKIMRFMLNIDKYSIKDKLVLEAGIGIGGIANYLAKEQECEMIGIDLGYGVDRAKNYFSNNQFFHIVQASVFYPPFEENKFDFVYSHGVLHHTFSTKKALSCLSKLPKNNGRLYAWVYSQKDESRNLFRKFMMVIENIIRPVMWRLPEIVQTAILLPLVPFYIFNQNYIRSNQNKNKAKYGWMEALHAARDRFTPRYAHRHSEEEVSSWLEELGYKNLDLVSSRQCPDFVPITHISCTGIEGKRSKPQD